MAGYNPKLDEQLNQALSDYTDDPSPENEHNAKVIREEYNRVMRGEPRTWSQADVDNTASYEEMDRMVPEEPSKPMHMAPASEPAPIQRSSIPPALLALAPQDDEQSYAQALEDARKSQVQSNLLRATNALLKGTAAYSGAKPDMSAANQALDESDRAAASRAANMLAQQKFGQETAQTRLQKSKAKMEADDLDPNSDASKSFRKMIEANFPDVVRAYGDSWDKVAAGDKDKIFDPLKLKEQIQARKDLARSKKAEIDKIDLEQKKADIKEAKAIKKENRKTREELEKSQQSAESILRDAEAAKEKLKAYSESEWSGTGPIATLGGLTQYASQETEALNSAFKKISMDSLTKQFAGMSKAIDSNAERRAFEATQPSITQDDKTNMEILDRQIAAARRLVEKSKAAKAQYDIEGNRLSEEPIVIPEEPSEKPQTKVVNGVTYQKVEGGWKKVK